MRLFYTLLVYLTMPFWLASAALSARRRMTPQPRWKERFGFLTLTPRSDRKRIWIHAVSVGEVMVIAPILNALKKRLPDYEFVVSTTTTTGQKTAVDLLRHEADHVVFFPFDLPGACRRAIRRCSPSVVIIAETELWPNFLREAKRFGAYTGVVNARLSDRSIGPALRLRRLYRAILSDVDLVLAQTETDAERFVSIGAKAERVRVAGNTKFDHATQGPTKDLESARNELGLVGDHPVLVVGSTRVKDGDSYEERFVFEAFALLLAEFPTLRMIVAPRHLERAGELVHRSVGQGLRTVRRTEMVGESGDYQVLALDTFGELAWVYGVATVAVVGGGFADLGGQNILQPLAHGKPTIFGPHMQNFRDVAAAAMEAGIGYQVSTPMELAARVTGLLKDPKRLGEIETTAKRMICANTGAAERCADAIAELLGGR